MEEELFDELREPDETYCPYCAEDAAHCDCTFERKKFEIPDYIWNIDVRRFRSLI